MRIVLGVVVANTGLSAMNVCAAERLGVDVLARRGLHERRPTQENPPLVTNDDVLVGHSGNISAARRAGAMHDSDLRDSSGRQRRLVIEDATEMLAVRKHLVLRRKKGTAALHEVDTRKPVLASDLLRSQMLLHRDRVVGAALHRGIVGNDDTLAADSPALPR